MVAGAGMRGPHGSQLSEQEVNMIVPGREAYIDAICRFGVTCRDCWEWMEMAIWKAKG
jgi:hypothetical protein